jgi:hypothetical protein
LHLIEELSLTATNLGLLYISLNWFEVSAASDFGHPYMCSKSNEAIITLYLPK